MKKRKRGNQGTGNMKCDGALGIDKEKEGERESLFTKNEMLTTHRQEEEERRVDYLRKITNARRKPRTKELTQN
jgi:hypothetical protein